MDLLFRAGIMTSGFVNGLKQLVSSSNQAAASLNSKKGIAGTLSSINTNLAGAARLYGVTTAIRAIGKAWEYAKGELDDYAKANRSSGVRQNQSDIIQGLNNRNVGRLADVSGVKDLWQEIASIPGRVAGSLLSGTDRSRLIGQESETRKRSQNQIYRDSSGALNEEALRLQGKNSTAEILRVRRELQSRLEEIRHLREDGKVDNATSSMMTKSARDFAAISTTNARLVNTQPAGRDIPSSMVKAFMGTADDMREADRVSAPRESVEQLRDRFQKMNLEANDHLQQISNNTNRQTFFHDVFQFYQMLGF